MAANLKKVFQEGGGSVCHYDMASGAFLLRHKLKKSQDCGVIYNVVGLFYGK
jgi:hypothetical protein